MVVGANAEIVSGVGVDVQLRRDAGLLQSEIHQYAVVRAADDVIPAVHEENWRRAGRNPDSGREFILLLVLEIAGINRDGEVGPAVCFIDLIDRLVGPLLETGRRGYSQMAAGGETDYSDAINVP